MNCIPHSVHLTSSDMIVRFPELTELLVHLAAALPDIVETAPSEDNLLEQLATMIQPIGPLSCRFVDLDMEPVVLGTSSSHFVVLVDYSYPQLVH